MRAAMLFSSALFLLAGCGGAPEAAKGGGMPPPPAVGVAAPISRELPVIRELTGRIEAVDLVEVRPRVGGVIERVLVADGAEVKPGDVLMELDQRPLAATLARAEADVASAEARLAQAERELERSRRLVAEKAVSSQVFEDNQSNVAVAKAQLAAAKAHAESARLDLSFTRVTSPIAGRIGRVLVQAGNLVQGGGPAPATHLATIVSIDPVYAAFDLDEAAWNRIGARMRSAAGGGAAIPVEVGVAGETGFPHTGTVAFADNQIDGASGSIRLRARVANAERLLLPGAFARVRIETEAPRPVLLIHEEAVLSQIATKYVLVVGEGGTTAFRPVVLGEQVGRLRVVREGLTTTDRIVVTNLAKVFYPGAPVVPSAVDMETLAAPAAAPEKAGTP